MKLFCRIVGFYVEPLSVKHSFAGGSWDGKDVPPALTTCKTNVHLDYDSVKERMKVSTGNLVFTYGVEWKSSEVCIFYFYYYMIASMNYLVH